MCSVETTRSGGEISFTLKTNKVMSIRDAKLILLDNALGVLFLKPEAQSTVYGDFSLTSV